MAYKKVLQSINVTLDRFIDEYGLNPQQLIDVKAFMGDTADGYSGVKGIGEKQQLN